MSFKASGKKLVILDEDKLAWYQIVVIVCIHLSAAQLRHQFDIQR